MKDMNQQILKAQGDPNESKYTLRHIVGKLEEKIIKGEKIYLK